MASERLKDALTASDLTRTDRLLMLLAEVDQPLKVAEIRDAGKEAGVAGIDRWNISQLLSRAGVGRARSVGRGWELGPEGRQWVATRIPNEGTIRAASALRSETEHLPPGELKVLVEEAVACVEHGHLRAAIVLSWVGAVAILQAEVVASHLRAFNTEASRRNPKWRPARTADDLGLMKEADFLDVLQATSVLGKNVKNELKVCLDLRNAVGHPNSLKVGRAKVEAHIETLLQNVYQPFT